MYSLFSGHNIVYRWWTYSIIMQKTTSHRIDFQNPLVLLLDVHLKHEKLKEFKVAKYFL